jgi:hypothetical protein
MSFDWSIFPGVILAVFGAVGAWLIARYADQKGRALLGPWSRAKAPDAFKIHQVTNWAIFVGFVLASLLFSLQFLGVVRAFNL